MAPPRATLEEVLQKILLNSIMDPVTDCALWQGPAGTGGYGRIGWQGKSVQIHRFLFQQFVDKDANIVRHSCDKPRCWNLAHLIDGTQFDNIRDSIERGRFTAIGTTHGMAKLNDTLVREIRTSNLTQEDLAAKLGVSQSTISLVRLGRIWKHVKD